MPYQSPWLDIDRPSWSALNTDKKYEVAIIGGGISGIASLYFILITTDKKVVLLEQNRVASGATGHNAGLAVPHIEKSVTELVEEYGYEKTKQIYAEIDQAWNILISLNEKIGLKSDFTLLPNAVFGFKSLEDLIESMKEEKIHAELGRSRWKYCVLKETDALNLIPQELDPYYTLVSQQQIIETLQITDNGYIGFSCRETPIGARMNSAQFCFKILSYLRENYPERFEIFENTGVSHIDINKDHNVLYSTQGKVTADDVILCTNGCTQFTIFDTQKKIPLNKLKDSIIPIEGYLAAYPTKHTDCYAKGFIGDKEEEANVPYWYVSNAPFSATSSEYLSVIGGPEYPLSEPTTDEIDELAKEGLEEISAFLNKTFGIKSFKPKYFWHGTMGYTENGLRWVGKDPSYPHVWYNLACNGIGIVQAIAGAIRISKLINGDSLCMSLYEPPK